MIGMSTKMRLSATMLMASMALNSFYGEEESDSPTSVNNSPNLRGIDLKKEYELIKQKKSNLSSNLRREVVYIVEKEIVK